MSTSAARKWWVYALEAKAGEDHKIGVVDVGEISRVFFETPISVHQEVGRDLTWDIILGYNDVNGLLVYTVGPLTNAEMEAVTPRVDQAVRRLLEHLYGAGADFVENDYRVFCRRGTDVRAVMPRAALDLAQR
jgi:hypothetical protein